jgi:hypothetical protein
VVKRLFSNFLRSICFIAYSLLVVIVLVPVADGVELEPRSVRLVEDMSRDGQDPNLSRVVSIILLQTNQLRQAQGLQPVYSQSALTAAAEYFANYMARTNKYGHTADGQQPSERAGSHGYDYCIITENIASQQSSVGFTTAQLARGFVEGWKRSDEHRENILDPDVVDIGLAVARSQETGAYFAVQMFGRPRHTALEFSVSNQTASELQYKVEQQKSEKRFSLAPGATRLHRQCRPSQLQFITASARKGLNAVHHGTHFIVSEGEDGALQIQTQPWAGEG